MDKIIKKLDDLQDKLQELMSISYQDGQKEYESLIQIIKRIIDRIYPEKQAMELKQELMMSWPEGTNQTIYVTHIDLAIRVIETIKAENELFGFEEFKPLKEKVKTEKQIGGDRFGFKLKKTTEKG